ncbi:hypothetical protein IQ31_02896 [Sphingobacterium siyangense]|uniref:Uncharacterized protein n=1 Tax=Sphingobacterium siyangense TaxID=459529 RepID=A0A562MGY4_9SPHI|nr:hypothetical protein IQ31_02896 [Sphingobacterium siyangense]
MIKDSQNEILFIGKYCHRPIFRKTYGVFVGAQGFFLVSLFIKIWGGYFYNEPLFFSCFR